jgi:hypothetical protein
MVDHFKILLHSLVEKPAQKIGAVTMQKIVEEKQLTGKLLT